MKLEGIPLIGGVIESGADDRVFDGLLLAGPVIVCLIILLGRNVLTEGVAVAYLVAFVVYVLYIGVLR